MRVRKKPWAAQELLDNTLVINDAPEKKGKWKEYFGNDHPIYVEIGCGKGGFLRKNAEAYPDVNFIGIERQETVVAMAARRADEELPNLAFVWDNASNLSDLFEVGEFQRLYLNFSDPWPKKRTYKRRLTYRGFLQEYRTEKTLEALKELSAPTARVRRGGRELEVGARTVVPGDVLLFKASHGIHLEQVIDAFLGEEK